MTIFKNLVHKNVCRTAQFWPQPRTLSLDTVGDVMAPSPLTIAPSMKVYEAVERVRQVGFSSPQMNTCYVVDENGLLLGLVTVRDLILARGGQLIQSVMNAPSVTLAPGDSQKAAAQFMEQFDLLELPVVEDERLVGVITADDAMSILKDEATEDMEHLAAMAPSEKPYLQASVWSIYRSRIVWLLVLMLSATITGAIISHFEAALAAQVALTAFIPMLMDTGGNCGSQSSVTVIRGLSLGEIRFSDWFQVVWKEFQVSLLCGFTLAAVTYLRVAIFNHQDPVVALVVAISLVVTIVSSKLIGCLLPIAARKAGMDPAVMASPLITTVVDATALITYFQVACWLLPM